MAESYDKLLMYIVENHIMPSDSRKSQIEATASAMWTRKLRARPAT